LALDLISQPCADEGGRISAQFARPVPLNKAERIKELLYFGKNWRKELVTRQYNTAKAASDYALIYDRRVPGGQFARSRLRLVGEILGSCPGGDLLDAGCGPGLMARTLADDRPGDFRVTVLDQSVAMVAHCIDLVGDAGAVLPTVGGIEALPFADASFDVILAMGVLEYADARAAIGELGRVTRRGGLVIVSMLSPFSPRRLAETLVYWPYAVILAVMERLVRVPVSGRRGGRGSGIRALRTAKLRRMMENSGLHPCNVLRIETPTRRRYACQLGRGGRDEAASARWRRSRYFRANTATHIESWPSERGCLIVARRG